jgi:hypothetical protein
MKNSKCNIACLIVLVSILSISVLSCTKTEGNYMCNCLVKDTTGYAVSTNNHDTGHTDWAGASVSCEATKAAATTTSIAINKPYTVTCDLQ